MIYVYALYVIRGKRGFYFISFYCCGIVENLSAVLLKFSKGVLKYDTRIPGGGSMFLLTTNKEREGVYCNEGKDGRKNPYTPCLLRVMERRSFCFLLMKISLNGPFRRFGAEKPDP